jgi:carboxypeptidase C (cathepsin A)
MGAFGPKMVKMAPNGLATPPPYTYIDNPNCLLDTGDLVFIDAMGTGFSRPDRPGFGPNFGGVDNDMAAFGEFIRSYISTYDRWGSPLFLLGESYGTTRSAGLAGYLFDKGINFNGICLLSTVLNLGTIVNMPGNDAPYPLLLPTCTMIAAYHGKLAPALQQDVDKTRREAVTFAMGDYWAALNKGDALSADQRAAIIEKVAAYTGLPKQIVDMANLRIDVPVFTKWLLADEKLRVGRLDGRYKSPDPESGFGSMSYTDPASSAMQGPFTMVFNAYVRNELGYKVDAPYYTSAEESGVFNWNFSEPDRGPGLGGLGIGYPETAGLLRQAVTQNPYLKVLVMEGYYDLATPFLGADYTMEHLDLLPRYRKNISFQQYYSGHMVYLDQKSHAKMKADYEAFIDQATAK